MSEAMAHTGRLEVVAEACGAINAGDFWEWHFAMLWDFIDSWLQCLEVLWLRCGSMLGKQYSLWRMVI